MKKYPTSKNKRIRRVIKIAKPIRRSFGLAKRLERKRIK